MRWILAGVAMVVLAGCEGRDDRAGATLSPLRAAGAGEESASAAGATKQADSALPAGTQSKRGATGQAAGTEPDTTRLGALRASTLPEGFDLVTAPRPFEFPRDHGPHPTFRHEWWYLTGHLDTPAGVPFGFELTFFRFALTPPPAAQSAASMQPATAAEPQSAWRARQIYMAHFAISDLERKNFVVSERFARDALGLAGAQPDPFRVSLDNWSLAASDTGAKTWRLVASDKGYTLDLEIDPSAPVMLNGDAGFSQKADAQGAASYYYSIPRMIAHGNLTRDGKSHDVKGTVWLDREWGSGALGPDQQGWDWFALQLNDGSALMFYALRKSSGARDTHSAGTWLAPDGKTVALANDEVQIESTAEWTSPRGTRYPARWHVRVPKLSLDVDIQPRLADQELNTSTRYWEGASLVKGTRENKPLEGKAYVELVGY
jgi:predicted secreted hydrolase